MTTKLWRTIPEPQAPAERRRSAQLAFSQDLAARYAALDDPALRPRPVDRVLRGLDIVLASLLLVPGGPVMGLAALSIKLTSGSPVLYRGLRVGRAGHTFTMYKLRTLRPDAEQRLGRLQDRELDRVTESEHTRVGRVLRATQLDELPQLFNVLRGEMSIVGPRPIRPVFFEELVVDIPQYWQRLVVRPGLTGFAQLRMRRDTTWAEKLAHDLEYLADRSVRLYAHIVIATVARLLRRMRAELTGAPPPGA
ncbi:MAG TPA: sugar transferase [Solirubrobacteraceae bacterium]|nr:sugar transferase [Solirubrobacteraceae bacterium]